MAAAAGQASVTVSLQFFAKARELLGQSSTTASLPAALSYPALLHHLTATFPPLAALGGTFVLALNEEFLPEELPVSLAPGDQLAVIPPLSGG
jgi:molybdopterin converting factor small subunit